MREILIKAMDYFYAISIALIIINIINQLLFRNSRTFKWGMLYFIAMLSMEVVSHFSVQWLGGSNISLFSVSTFISFSFLLFLYLRYLYGFDLKKTILIISLSTVPMIIQFSMGYDVASYQSYDRVLYNSTLMIMAMTDIYFIISEKVPYSSTRLFLARTILLFFSFETLISIPSNFLINGNKELVTWIWSLRALALHSYYISLIFFTRKSDRIIPSIHLDNR